ncbi:MAG TPA: gephyrin-like molybdotransferase Glp [Gemmatimonadaceae bacterium]|nr:gephyrin-like molybdotransferase Glp [Gemmatimonadaceae bacterium]
MLPLAHAVAQVMAELRPLPSVELPLADAAGCVLAQAVVSPLDLPPWDNAAMDGYAVRAADVAGASAEHPVTLRVIETIAAGGAPARRVGVGEAAAIMTGAPVPAGADSVVRVEDTDGGVERVVIGAGRDAGRNIRPRGEDVREGEAVLPAGIELRGAQLGLLASVGVARPLVHRRPRVALLSSGDELVPVERFAEVRDGRRIVGSNAYALAALVREAGGEVVDLGIAPDAPAALRERVRAARGCDLLVTTAGASVGAHDYTRRVLDELGAELRFWRVRIRPGAQLAFGVLDGMPWLGLPGNPVSALVTFELFARPAIRRMLGHRHAFRRPVTVQLAEPLRTAGGADFLLRAVVERDVGGAYVARLTGPQGSGMLSSMARANALLVVDAATPTLDAGARVPALLLGDDASFAADFSLH